MLSVDEVQIGQELPPVSGTITQETINNYAEMSTDWNPLHVDEEFGKKTPYGSTIAHGPIALDFALQMINRWLGVPWIKDSKVNAKFIAPVRPGDTVTARGKISSKEQKEGKNWVNIEFFLENQKGEKVIVGDSVFPYPAE